MIYLMLACTAAMDESASRRAQPSADTDTQTDEQRAEERGGALAGREAHDGTARSDDHHGRDDAASDGLAMDERPEHNGEHRFEIEQER